MCRPTTGRRRRSSTRSAIAARSFTGPSVEFFESNYRADAEIAHTREYLLVVGGRR
jgi:hypothetical protein